ncbi:ABC transporter permease [Krasilnikoviella flava]|uniref:Putative spermidine/putrescine transport system permease protein n=1 Tax=Krasilnikoviella flava TaxID=526729 RepID=A0A1T5LEY0_9MICO|nr:ABC transporter permease subunit [Krasilnikoviella flava]SKC74255.1 putative spermidine/putrescine transport system permease protein [Krasilnikoviella flava]
MTAVADRPARSTASLRHRLAERGVDSSLWLMVPALVFALALFVYPFSYGIGLTFQPSVATQEQWGGGILANYVAFFRDPFVFDSIWITMRLALPAALFNVLASIPVAMVLRRRFRFKRFMTSVLVLPITLGTVLTAQGLLIFAGRQGWLNRFLIATGLVDQPVQLVNNYTGVMFSLIITGFPFAFLLVSSYLSGIDPSLDSAARTLGAGWWQRFRRITLPLLAPGLATTFILTFVLAFSVFPSARLVGDAMGSTRVMSLMAFRAFGEQNDYAMASTIALMMGVVELIVVAVVLAWRSLLYKGSTGGKG